MATGLSEPAQPAPEEFETLVRGVPFFQDLDRVAIARLVGALDELRRGAGEIVFAENQDADALYLLQQGRVEVFVNTPRGERRLAVLEAPHFFGELGLLLERRTSSVRALSDLVLQRLPRARFEELARERPLVGLQVAKALAKRFERRQRRLAGAPAPPLRETVLEPPVQRAPRRLLAGAALALLVPALLWNLAPPAGLDQRGWQVLLVLAGGAIGWLLEPLPDFVVAIATGAAWGILALAPLASVFAGFSSSSWVMALGALAVAAAMTRSGLLYRAALELLRVFPGTHRGQVLALLLGGLLVTPLVPLSVARVGAIAPLSVELAQALGYAARSRAAAALSLAAFTGYWYFSSVFLTGFATNFFVLGLLSVEERVRFDWLGWLTAAAVVGVVCLIGAALALFALFPPERTQRRGDELIERQRHVLGAVSREEWVALAAILVLLGGLVTQPLTGLDPAWPALASIVVAMAGSGLDRERFRSAIDWGFLVLFGMLLGYGDVLQRAGVDAWLAGALVPAASSLQNPGLLVLLVALIAVATRFVLPSRPTIFLLCLALVPLGPAVGIDRWIVGFVVLVAANIWIFPYQGLEYLIARDATRGLGFTDAQGVRMGAALTVVRVLAVAASVPYWHALGLIR